MRQAIIVHFPRANVSKITLSPALTRGASGFVLGAFAHMDACPLLITSIVVVKPEDQGTFFQDFLGLSGYLCSVPEMLRTTMKPNMALDSATAA